MKINTNYQNGNPHSNYFNLDIVSAVEAACDGSRNEDQQHYTNTALANTQSLIGHLILELHTTGVLNNAAVMRVLGNGFIESPVS